VPQLGGNFVMTTLFPKKTFEKDDMSRSLAELELVPSASIVVVPVILTTLFYFVIYDLSKATNKKT
jgi:hypothetical protein